MAGTADIRLLYHSLPSSGHQPPPPSETKIKIGLTRGLVEGGEIFAQFSLSTTAHFQHLYTYIKAICAQEKLLAVYWFSRNDREFVLIHDDGTLDQCLSNAGLHEILYVITEQRPGYASNKISFKPVKPELIQLKTSSPSSGGPSPDTASRPNHGKTVKRKREGIR
eukprot:sb/3472471/